MMVQPESPEDKSTKSRGNVDAGRTRAACADCPTRADQAAEGSGAEPGEGGCQDERREYQSRLFLTGEEHERHRIASRWQQ